MEAFQIFVKPAGARCNLGCKYCYYLPASALYERVVDAVMPYDVLERYIIRHFEASEEADVFFSWHGGEPLLAGLDFYRKAVELQKKYKPAKSLVRNGIQTNGTLIDEEWARFLASENFIMGLSLDGPAEFHDKYRTSKNGKTTFKEAFEGFQLLNKHGIVPEVLCVLNAYNAGHPEAIYTFFRDIGARYITFLPLVGKEPSSSDGVSHASVTPEAFGDFLCSVFDMWVARDIGEIKIQIIEEAVRTAFGQEHTLCIFKENCGRVPVVEHNGDFYSCDHYVNSTHQQGNIIDHSLSHLLESDRQRSFGKAKSATLPRWCKECEVLAMCHGECPKNRFTNAPDGEPGLNYLCKGYRKFFNHCRPFIEAVSVAWKNY